MREIALSLPMFGLAVSTRIALGVGVGLLVAGNVGAARRKSLGAALLAVGAVTTIPVVRTVIRSARGTDGRSAGPAGQDPRLVGASRLPRKGDDLI